MAATKENPGISRLSLRHWRLMAMSCLGLLLLVSMKRSLGDDEPAVRKGTMSPAVDVATKRPFMMPIEGKAYKIFQPIYDMVELAPPLFYPAQDFISAYTKRLGWVNTMIKTPPTDNDEDYARLMYLEVIKSMVSATVFGNKEQSVMPQLRTTTWQSKPLDKSLREGGKDWTYVGDTSKSFGCT
jgi:hypothetical protein